MLRNSSISILKGIGIILVVFGHASENIKVIYNVIYSFHMPLFFIASGFFFKITNIENLKVYVMKKIHKLYIPFIKWSLIFLLLHNIFFYIGILNDKFGNTEGITSHLYTLKDIIHRAINICIRMTDYESFLLGTYWFVRALFVSSILTAFATWFFNKKVSSKPLFSILYTIMIFSIVGGSMRFFNIYIPFYPQGGYREMMAVYFIGIGYIFGQTQIKNLLSNKWGVIIATIILLTLSYVSPCNMNSTTSVRSWATILITGPAGFILIYFISQYINKKNNLIKRFLVYSGDKSFYIMTFHFLMFKPVSLLMTYIYSWDWHMIGCHGVIYTDKPIWWIIYTIISIYLSLLLYRVIKKMNFKLPINY